MPTHEQPEASQHVYSTDLTSFRRRQQTVGSLLCDAAPDSEGGQS